MADVDGDHRLDLIAGTAADVSVRLAQADHTFGDATRYLSGSGERALATGDWDGDGDTDLMVTDSSTGEASVLLGQGDGTFEPSGDPHTLFVPGDNPRPGRLVTLWSITPGDFDQDGDLDLAVSRNYSYDNNIAILRGHGDGSFDSQPRQYRIIGSPNSIVSGDLDSDGDLDLAVAHGGYHHLPDYGWWSGGCVGTVGQR